MTYDDGVAQRVREALDGLPDVVEKKMFGGLAFMLRGNMCCGVVRDQLMLRVGMEGYEAALARAHARQMDFTGKPLRGFVYVAAAGFDSDKDLQDWVDRSVQFVMSLPAKR
ncbi:MAG: TfoX/Sxy family protein [Candidatus Krumholzibacteria bacterium]|nr:TfoX/Sxy family protein [Candidatus Krumholzibacteria bacterium]